MARFFKNEKEIRTYRYRVAVIIEKGDALTRYSEKPAGWPECWEICRGDLRISGGGKGKEVKSIEWIPENKETEPSGIDFEIIRRQCDEISSVVEALRFFDQESQQSAAQEEISTPEGRITLGQHFRRERSPLLVKKFKERLAKDGPLRCSICDFSFSDVYGEKLGKGFIEAHHKRPLGESEGERETKLDDLVAVCSNCHRMLHRLIPVLTVDKLKRIMKTQEVRCTGFQKQK